MVYIRQETRKQINPHCFAEQPYFIYLFIQQIIRLISGKLEIYKQPTEAQFYSESNFGRLFKGVRLSV